MTLDEAIERLRDLREVVGGDAPFCIEKERIDSGRVNIFEPAAIEVYNAVLVETGTTSHWAVLMNGNSTQIVAVF